MVCATSQVVHLLQHLCLSLPAWPHSLHQGTSLFLFYFKYGIAQKYVIDLLSNDRYHVNVNAGRCVCSEVDGIFLRQLGGDGDWHLGMRRSRVGLW